VRWPAFALSARTVRAELLLRTPRDFSAAGVVLGHERCGEVRGGVTRIVVLVVFVVFVLVPLVVTIAFVIAFGVVVTFLVIAIVVVVVALVAFVAFVIALIALIAVFVFQGVVLVVAVGW
jgi:hypothetical protein